MQKKYFVLGIIAVLMLSVIVACAAPTAAPQPTPAPVAQPTSAPATTAPTAAPPTTAPAETGEIKIGVMLPFTGVAAAVGQQGEQGILYAIQEMGGEINGRKIVIVKEDETDNPNNAVAKAKKLVEEDKVVAIVGPLLASNGAAVGGYLAPLNIPHLALGAADGPTSTNTFYPGSGRGDAYPSGWFAYDEMKARKAAVLYADYAWGQQSRDGFKAAFEERGGKVVSEQGIPFGVSDMAPYLQNLGDADLIAVLLLNPSDFGFAGAYKGLGLKQPVMFISNAPQEVPLLAQMGDVVVGWHGSSWYSALIDSEINKKFVEGYSQKFNMPPGMASHTAYTMMATLLQGLKATNGDTTNTNVIDALTKIENLPNPAGPMTMPPGRVAIHDQFVFVTIKAGDNLYLWQPVKRYERVQPK